MIRPRKIRTTIRTSVVGRQPRDRGHGVVDELLGARADVRRRTAAAPAAAGARRVPDPVPVLDHARIFAPGARGRCRVGVTIREWPRRRSGPERRPTTRWSPGGRPSSGTPGARRSTAWARRTRPARCTEPTSSRWRRRRRSPPRRRPGARSRSGHTGRTSRRASRSGPRTSPSTSPRSSSGRAAIRWRPPGCARRNSTSRTCPESYVYGTSPRAARSELAAMSRQSRRGAGARRAGRSRSATGSRMRT